jgi:hypothetical protein
MRSAVNIIFLSLAKSQAAIEPKIEVLTDLRLLDAYCGEVDGTAIDVPAKPRHERVLRISVTADIYPVVQNGRHDDSLKHKNANGSGGKPGGRGWLGAGSELCGVVTTSVASM